MIYLDTCALTKLVTPEAETPALVQFLDERREEMVSSDIALTELLRAARRKGFDNERRPKMDPLMFRKLMTAAARLIDELDLVVLDKVVLIAAGMYERDPILKSLATIHLVSALEISPRLTAFVTYDKQLARAAEEAGLPLLQPA